MVPGHQSWQGQHSHLAKAVVRRNNHIAFASASSPSEETSTFAAPASTSTSPVQDREAVISNNSNVVEDIKNTEIINNCHNSTASGTMDVPHQTSSPSISSPYQRHINTPHPSNSHHEAHLMPPLSKTVVSRALGTDRLSEPLQHHHQHPQPHAGSSTNGVGIALTDTPATTAPPSPQITPHSYGSGTSTPGRPRATTLDIPGLTKSKVSPDGRIAQRDVGSKLVIVMVGLPARGKSYITKKLSRYLNWLQHDTRIFNVGERRRVVAGEVNRPPSVPIDPTVDARLRKSVRELSIGEIPYDPNAEEQNGVLPDSAIPPATILVNDECIHEEPSPAPPRDPSPMTDAGFGSEKSTNDESDQMDQSAEFFDPENDRAVQLREQVALDTLDELLDYILEKGGSVGILDATNSTLERRKSVMDHIRDRAGPTLNVLYLESCCYDENLLKGNMRLKLSGPDYKGMEPTIALDDFQRRVKLYEKSYVSLGEYEETHNMPYVQTIDVSRKVVAHQANGFIASQVVYYLLNFNLSPRQIWISRHGESLDDLSGKIGGNAPLSEDGISYAKALTKFIDYQRNRWEEYQKIKALSTHFPPLPGDSTPPNPQYAAQTSLEPRNFCVWSSMLLRSSQTAQFFDDEEYDVKEMRMLNELNAGLMEGMTYNQIREKYPAEFEARRQSKLHYRFPGPGGEGYLDVINRLRAVIIEVERMTEHVLLIGPRSVARTLLAYFLGLKREDLTDLDVPPGIIYSLEPKPYGVEYNVYKYDPETSWFEELPDYKVGQKSYY